MKIEFKISVFLLVLLFALSFVSAADSSVDASNLTNVSKVVKKDALNNDVVHSSNNLTSKKQAIKTINNTITVNSSGAFDEAINWIEKNGTKKEYTINLTKKYEYYGEYYNLIWKGNKNTKSLVINGNNNLFRMFEVTKGTSLTLNSLIIENKTSHSQTLNKNYGNLTINNCTFRNNYAYNYEPPTTIDDIYCPAITSGVGGALFSVGNLSVCGCVFGFNVAGLNGSAVFCDGGSVVLSDCVFVGNCMNFSSEVTHGCLFVRDCVNVSVVNCSFVNNSADCGAGICLVNDSNVSIRNCSFVGNRGSSVVEVVGSRVSFKFNSASGNRGDYFLFNNGSKVFVGSCSLLGNGSVFNVNKGTVLLSGNVLRSKLRTNVSVVRLNTSLLSVRVVLCDVSGGVVDGFVVVKVNSRLVSRGSVVGGVVNVSVSDKFFTFKRNNLSVSYVNGSFASSSVKSVITKRIYNTSVRVNHTFGRPKSYVLFNASVRDSNGLKVLDGSVVFKLNGVSLKDKSGNVIYSPVRNGFVQLKYYVGSMSTKKYTLTAVYKNSGNYLSSRVNNALSLYKNRTSVGVVNSSLVVVSGRSVKVTSRVVRGDGVVVRGGNVSFVLNGNVVRDGKGRVVFAKVVNGRASANISVPVGTGSKNYSFVCVYGGSTSNEKAVSKDYGLFVVKDSLKVSVSDSPIVVSRGSYARIALKVLSSRGRSTRWNHTVSFFVDGKSMGRGVVVNGVLNYSLDTRKLSRNAHDLSIVVGENDAYYGTKLNTKLIVV